LPKIKKLSACRRKIPPGSISFIPKTAFAGYLRAGYGRGLQFISQYFNMVFLNEFMPENLFSEDFAVNLVDGAVETE
jgi:hypothetical protein